MIYIKSPSEINFIREINKFGAELLFICNEKLQPGVITKELDDVVLQYCNKHNIIPSFKGYKGFPYNLCVSINEEVIHGFPSERIILNGDIVSIDVGLQKNGYYSDAAFTKIIGNVSNEITKLVVTTEECLCKGISKAIPGNRIYDISFAIQQHAESNGFNVVKPYVGHGVGIALHEDPKIPNYVAGGVNWLLVPGMVIAIEPIIVEGHCDVYVEKNNWTVITKDGGLSAHFEHSVAITENGPEILSI
jgi:methionyl aminopeptidase